MSRPEIRTLAVVVHFDAPERTRRCVESLRAQDIPVGVTLVDHSESGSAPVMAGDPPVRSLLRENNGFAAGLNAALKDTSAEFVLLLNPDAVADPAWARSVTEALHADPRAGMAAIRVRLGGSEEHLDSAGLALTRGGMGVLRGHGHPLRTHAGSLNAQPLLGPTGAAAAYRREMIEDLGGFPEDYFLYYEDLEVALRARRRGWTCAWVDEPLVTHDHESGAGAAKPYYLARARRLFALRNLDNDTARDKGSSLLESTASYTRAALRGGLGDVRRAERDAEAHYRAHPPRFDGDGPLDPGWLAGSVGSILKRGRGS